MVAYSLGWWYTINCDKPRRMGKLHSKRSVVSTPWRVTYWLKTSYVLLKLVHKSQDILHAACEVKWKSLSRVQLFAIPWTIQSVEFSRPEYWSGYPSLLQGSSQPRDQILVSRIAGRLPAKPQGKPKNIGVGILSLLLQIFPTQGLNLGLLHCRRILYQLSNEGSPYSTFKNRILGLPWLSRGWDIMLLPQGTSVWSLVEELGSHMLHVTKEQGQKFFFNKNSPYTPRASKWCKTEFTF